MHHFLQPLSETERMARIRLIRSQSIGPITFYKALARYGSATNAIAAMIAKGKDNGLASHDDIRRELDAIDAYGGYMIVFGDPDYPQWLTTIEDAPVTLCVMGDSTLLSQESIAIVGARNASHNAKRLTHNLARGLGQHGYVITSGLARGIDTIAHQSSIETGTIAVMAGGINRIYPTENTNLYHEITEQGCIISEMPFDTAPTAHHFPRRNRIVSGLSKGTVIVEATMKSGSLITARMATEQNRDVFAVPGFPGDPRAEGPNSLIKNGAILTQNADDIIVELQSSKDAAISHHHPSLFDSIAEDTKVYEIPTMEAPSSPAPQSNLEETIRRHLSPTPMDIDALCRSCNTSAQAIQMTLIDMELCGEVQRHPGNRVSIVK